jgi:hypothetical protein
MQSITMAIHPAATTARVLAMQGGYTTLLKAHLQPRPAHPRALPYLLEAIALWQGIKVRAALCVDNSLASFDSNHYPDLFSDAADTPLYALDWVSAPRRGLRHKRDIRFGDFRDLQRLVLREGAR